MRVFNWKRHTWRWLAAACISTAAAAPGIISTSTSTPGPVNTNDTFKVTLTISGYTDTNQIDGFNFKVSYSSNLFSFVSGSFILNDAAGTNENWLRLAPQDGVGAGPILTDFSDGSLPGSIAVSVTDLRFTSTNGTTAATGFLISFDLMAIGIGTGSITPSAGPGGTVLFDNSLSPAGVPIFGPPSSMTVVPEPAPILLLSLSALIFGVLRVRAGKTRST